MNNLLQLAPYGLGPLVAAYGAARGARAVYSATSRRPAYRKTRRVPRTLRVKGLHSFRRSINLAADYIPTTGFTVGALTGTSMTLTFSLSEVRGYLGASSFAIAVPGATDFTNLFDAWRIKAVRVSVFFQNTSSTSASVATNMPLIVYVWDKEDKSIDSIATINQFETSKRYQFGNGASRGGALMTMGKPHASSTGPLTNGGSAGIKVEPASTWLETTQPTVEYQSLKLGVDGFGATQATTEGRFAFYIDVFYELKDVI